MTDAGFSSVSLIHKGLLLGCVHVFTPDHLSALSALSVGGSWRAFSLGVRWGIGHSSGLLIVTLIFIAMKGRLNLRYIGRWCDATVGAFMIVLGLYGVVGTLKDARERKAKREDKDGPAETSRIGKANGGSLLGDAPPRGVNDLDDLECPFQFVLDTRDPLTQRLASLGMGILHGFAGPGGVLAVLPTVEMTRWQSSCLYLFSFIVASTISMGMFAALYGEATRRVGEGKERVEVGMRLVSSAVAIIVGAIWLSLSILGKLSEFQGH